MKYISKGYYKDNLLLALKAKNARDLKFITQKKLLEELSKRTDIVITKADKEGAKGCPM